jgi:peptide/nickel transport system substrate-binding protein
VYVPDFRHAVGRYFTRLLRDLGFRASLREVEVFKYFGTINNPRSRVQMGFEGYLLDYGSPALILAKQVNCGVRVNPEVNNAAHFCNRALERRVARVTAAPPADSAKAWVALDRRITDLAPAVPMTNQRSVVLISKRAGNVQHHPQWFTLLDQMWVR